MSNLLPTSGELQPPGPPAQTRSPGFPFDFEDLQACIRWGLLVVNETGLIVFATERGLNFLAAGSGIVERSGKFHVERTGVDRGLQRLIRLNAARCTEAHSHRDHADALGVPDRDGRTRYVLMVLPLAVAKTGSLVLIAISDLLVNARVDRSTIAAIFNLSAREAELGELFSNGLRIDEIAPRMGVAMNTVRAHLRSVLAKTGCSGQIELARTFARLF